MATFKRSNGIIDVGTDGTTGYNFKNEDDGETSPTDWTNADEAPSTTTIIANYEGHRKVVYQYDTTGDYAQLYHDWDNAQSYGVCEFLITDADVAGFGRLELRDTDNTRMLWVAYGLTNKVQCVNGAGPAETLATTNKNEWTHISIEWNNSGVVKDLRGDGNLANDKFRVYVNGVQNGDYDFENDVSPQRMWITTAEIGGQIYWDGFAFTNTVDWNVAYSIGDNKQFEVDTAISASDVKKFVIHHPTSLQATNVRFGKTTYAKKFPIGIAMLEPDVELLKGAALEVTDNLTAGGATASSVIFRGTIQRILRSRASGFIPRFLLYANSAEQDNVYPTGSYTVDTDGYIADIISNDCELITNGGLTDGEDLGTFTAGGDKNFGRIIDDNCRIDGYIQYYDSSSGDDNADLLYNDGSTDTGVDITESTSGMQLVSIEEIDEHINWVMVRGGLKSDKTRAESTPAEHYASQTQHGVRRYYDTDSNLSTDAMCTSKAQEILNQNEYGRLKARLKYRNATEGMLQPGENVTFSWDSTIHDIFFDIESSQYIVSMNSYDAKTGVNVLDIMSGIYYAPPIVADVVQENSQRIEQNTATITEQHDRNIYPSYLDPNDGRTAGANNCYKSGSYIGFGTDAYTTGNSALYVYYVLPDAYVAGEDITFVFWWSLRGDVGGSAEDTLNYRVQCRYMPDGSGLSVAHNTGSQTDTGADNYCWNPVSTTITGTNLIAGMSIEIDLWMEDDDNAFVSQLGGFSLSVPVNTRD